MVNTAGHVFFSRHKKTRSVAGSVTQCMYQVLRTRSVNLSAMLLGPFSRFTISVHESRSHSARIAACRLSTPVVFSAMCRMTSRNLWKSDPFVWMGPISEAIIDVVAIRSEKAVAGTHMPCHASLIIVGGRLDLSQWVSPCLSRTRKGVRNCMVAQNLK